ncbi:TPA: restriction endonuclease subunit S [Klebsiella michiganensis]|uniref:restriction endonuclease subunit S n=1 Tax=Klebsiella michiganensis TaxID=1134687 RepID=UPI001CCC9A23|nr:restriction endonuclease subunit S [Klebsiella michiganensis]ELG9969573.1 restriction endonuclease subunit S [Klebsiella michiganensis]MBZ7228117.1 restriction endonuclease subunit S [Klebsiella michiganensis]HBM2936714.1 restriction endonuclease subunit S [Klebsiella michiganensis]HDX9002348.1 restriction endonuclease subunit S [Klebsiella michiganensis]
MAKYKAYPEYKDSGVEWLGEVPNHWKTVSISRLFSRIKRTGYTEKELLSVYRDYGVIPKSSRDDNNNKPSEDLSPYQLVEPNDLVMNKMKAWQGSIAISEYEGIVSPAYFVYKPNNILFELAHPRYVHYLLRNPIYVTQYLSRSKGIRVNQWDLDPDEFRNIELLLPDKTEQEKIYSFLDHETAKIDNLIEKQQQLIELLKEKRQAVISHAVTKGLNPDVPMKDSGVEWLGEVPEHWGVTRLKYECRNIVDCPHSTPNYTDEGEYPAIRTADILAGYLDLDNCRRVTKSIFDERNFRLIPKAGDIIYSREGERFGIGAPIPEGAKVCLAQRVMLFRAKSTPGYLMWALNSSSTYTQAQQDCIGATSPHVNVDTIKNFILSWPPEKEREEISNFIYQTLDSIESLTVHLTEKLTLLQERRTALISAAVTGKIDVRDWVAPDTQDIEEPEEATV